MGQRISRREKTRALVYTVQRCTPPTSSTYAAAQHPHPFDGKPVGVGEGDQGQERGREGKRRERKRFWRFASLHFPGKKHPKKSSSGQSEKVEQEKKVDKVAQAIQSRKSANGQISLQDITCAVEGNDHQQNPASNLEVLPTEVQVLQPATLEEIHDTPANPAAGDTVALEQLESDGVRRIEEHISNHYYIGSKLGEGGFGAVYEGIRRDDNLKVAMKFVCKEDDMKYISIPGHDKPLPLEVALTILANEGPSVPEIIQLLDWQELPDQYIMVLEHPSPCQDLFDFLEHHGGSLSEGLARLVMRQATKAAHMCCRRGVFHRDVKLENLLVNTDTLEVKLIDFGCGDLLTKSPYKTFGGTKVYCPPEVHMKGEYHGKPATVWSLGILLFVMVCGHFPETFDLNLINSIHWSKPGLSKECCKLIGACLQFKPKRRLRLGKMLQHPWFKVTTQ